MLVKCGVAGEIKYCVWRSVPVPGTRPLRPDMILQGQKYLHSKRETPTTTNHGHDIEANGQTVKHLPRIGTCVHMYSTYIGIRTLQVDSRARRVGALWSGIRPRIGNGLPDRPQHTHCWAFRENIFSIHNRSI